MDKNTTAAQGTRAGAATLVVSALSNQLCAATGSMAFPGMGPVGVVAVRQFIAAAVLLPIVRPRFWTLTRHQWWPVLLLAVVFGTMNLTLYSAIERVGLGLAVTLEFLGPLSVALLGSRSKASALCAVAAGLGVVAITRPKPSTDYFGIGLALVAAASWAAYILLNRRVGQRVPGVEGAAIAAGVSAILFLPVALIILPNDPPDPFTVFCAVGAGVLASVVPYLADLITLRRMTPNVFGILMSINPVFAALIGAVALHEVLAMPQWAGIALIVGANICALLFQGRKAHVGRFPSR
ncbi:inner membrane transporter RhtA [Arthrobacter sp. V4I6]|uniref:EamA family transporter n=1 Tax=unclassified Arthrobacter TaxID=235627 RepID=UPI00278A92F1|nr:MULTISPECIES: EamA family transporter [unclassified Arthrobacter]MDQ0820685.1 inner membrane transporter RhtA [Arthrobacter sp. V1I7]MDQ0854944.1 inner membrane transporter RhtA [Arthrobacter sp. V4I6]